MGNADSDESSKTEWKMVGAQVPSDLHDRIKEHKEKEGHPSKSENVRALFRKGLKYDESPAGIPVPALIVWAGSLLIFSTLEWQLESVSSDWIAVFGFVLIVVGVSYEYVRS